MRRNWDPADMVMMGRRSLKEKLELTMRAAETELGKDNSVYSRHMSMLNNTIAEIFYPETKQTRHITMFGSNNYLGLASDPRLIDSANHAMKKYGVGVCGSSFLNGYSFLQRELEELTATLKGTEDCIVLPSGFAANMSWATSLLRQVDSVICDEESHMSFREAARGNRIKLKKFKHNDFAEARQLASGDNRGDQYIFVEGLYSMRGDMADITLINNIAQETSSILVVDDAHGTGTLGASGKGSTEGVNIKDNVLIVGTYSKALGTNGGFICGSKPIIDCLRILSQQYMFSAALSPASMSGALQGIKILMAEPERVSRLKANTLKAYELFSQFNCVSEQGSPILFLKSGQQRNAMDMAKRIETKGFFVNPISFPAVGLDESGIRINLSSEHTDEQLNQLFDCIASEWQECT